MHQKYSDTIPSNWFRDIRVEEDLDFALDFFDGRERDVGWLGETSDAESQIGPESPRHGEDWQDVWRREPYRHRYRMLPCDWCVTIIYTCTHIERRRYLVYWEGELMISSLNWTKFACILVFNSLLQVPSLLPVYKNGDPRLPHKCEHGNKKKKAQLRIIK